MRVLCIDNKPRPEEGPVNENGVSEILNENQVYTVGQRFNQARGYNDKILNIPVYTLIEIGSKWGFAVDRFVPISDIDETEFIREYNLEKV